MEEVENFNLRFVKTQNGNDYYVRFRPDEEPIRARVDDPSRYIVVKSDSPNGTMLRDMLKRPGVKFRMQVRDDYEGLPTIKSLEVQDLVDEFSLKYTDPDTGAEVSLKFPNDLALAHDRHMQSLALEGFSDIFFSRISKRAYSPDEVLSEEKIERQQIIAHMNAQLAANSLLSRKVRYEDLPHLFDAYRRRKEFASLKTDLFPLYTLLYRPAVARPIGSKKEDGKDFYLSSMFKSRDEEAAFMLALYEEPVDSFEEKPKLPLTERIRRAVPGLDPVVASNLAYIYSHAGPNSKRYLRSLYDRKILITEDPAAEPCKKDLQEAGAQIERLIEGNGVDGLQQIFSMELRNLIRENNSRLQGMDITNLPKPRRFRMGGKLYEFVSLNPSKPNDFIVVGPIMNENSESFEAIFLDERIKSQDSEENILSRLSEKMGFGLLPIDECLSKIIDIDGSSYTFGENGHLYAGDFACNVNSFTQAFLQPPRVDLEDYAYNPKKFIEIAKDFAKFDENSEQMFTLSGSQGEFLFAVGDDPTLGLVPYVQVTEKDMEGLSSAEEEAWMSEHADLQIPQDAENLISEYLSGNKACIENLCNTYPALKRLFELNPNIPEADLRAAIHAEVVSHELMLYDLKVRSEKFKKLSETLSNGGAQVKDLDTFSNLGGNFKMVNGKIFCAPEQNSKLFKRCQDFYEELHDKSRGIFHSPTLNRADPYDGAWHEGDAQQMPEYARDILHKFRDLIAAKYGGDIKADLDQNWYELLQGCNNSQAEFTESMTIKDKEAYLGSCISLYRFQNTPLTAKDMDISTVEKLTLDDLIDPNLSYEETPISRRKNPDKLLALKESYLNSFIAVQIENTAAFAESAYAELINEPDLNKRIQAISPAFCQGTPGELCIRDAHYTEYGEHNIHNTVSLGIRETLKAFAYIRNECNELPTGEKVDIGLANQILRQLPQDRPYASFSADELMTAAYKASCLRSQATRETLINEDKKAFKDKLAEIAKIRKKRLEDCLTNVFSAPGRAISHIAAALEQL